jgi:predicted nuclease of predicted toxin-antitoxin system
MMLFTLRGSGSRGLRIRRFRVAREQDRILVTRDRDFGNLVFVKNLGAGVIYLRIVPSTLRLVQFELERGLNFHSEGELSRAFVVVESGGHRIRHLPGDVGLSEE